MYGATSDAFKRAKQATSATDNHTLELDMEMRKKLKNLAMQHDRLIQVYSIHTEHTHPLPLTSSRAPVMVQNPDLCQMTPWMAANCKEHVESLPFSLALQSRLPVTEARQRSVSLAPGRSLEVDCAASVTASCMPGQKHLHPNKMPCTSSS